MVDQEPFFRKFGSEHVSPASVLTTTDPGPGRVGSGVPEEVAVQPRTVTYRSRGARRRPGTARPVTV